MIRALKTFFRKPSPTSLPKVKSPDPPAPVQKWKRYRLQSGLEIWVKAGERLIPGCEIFQKLRDGSFAPVQGDITITITLTVEVTGGKVSTLHT